jgi:broad specificity phosphatase PhoE
MNHPVKLYFMRHGESIANLTREFSNTGYKHPLTETGVQQARAAADVFRRLAVEKIYSSPVLRAMQTAQILAEKLQVPLETAEALREWNVGVYEGTADSLGWDLHSRVQKEWFVHRKLDSKMPGGESFNEIRGRFVPFIQRLARDGDGTKRSIALVGHGGLYMAMLPVIFTNIDYAFARRNGFPYAGVAVSEPRPDGLYCLSWCGISLGVEKIFK